VFLGFGDSTLDLELRGFIASRDTYGRVLHELNVAVERAFRESGIEIAFPQQDINIRSLPLPLASDESPPELKLRRAA
jgi:potassium efflux system protein